MSCLFGKEVCFHLLRMASREIKLKATPEKVNTLERKDMSTRENTARTWENDPIREAIVDREWFMRHGRVEDALRRLCGLEGPITIESLERRMGEAIEAIDKRHGKKRTS